MVAKQELQALAGALKSTPEYVTVIRMRQRILGSPMGTMMLGFEREHKRLSALRLPEQAAADRMKRLYTNYRSFLEHPAVKEYIRSAQTYERVVSESIEYLQGIAGTGGPLIRR